MRHTAGQGRSGAVRLIVAASSVLTLLACHKRTTEPALALQECDPAGYVACLPQEAFASIPITDTGLFLTYSSRWAPHPSGRPDWDAARLGLGGWSLNPIQRYDRANHLLVGGDGSWRFADGVSLASGEVAVPSYDGTGAYIFDSAGRHVRSVDARLGTQQIKIAYDNDGRLSMLDGSINNLPVRVSVRRDANGRATSLVSADGAQTALELDGNGHLLSATNPAGETTYVAWNAAGLVESVTDPTAGVARFTYDRSGRLATLTDPDGIILRFDYMVEPDAFEIRASTPQARHWSYRAESVSGGIRRTVVALDGSRTTETTDAHGARRLELADGTTYAIGLAPNPVWGRTAPVLTPIVETRADGISSRREVNYALHPQGGVPYALTGSITTTINGQHWIEAIDSGQRTTTVLDPGGRRTIAVYDAAGRLMSSAAPGVAPVSYTYDARGRIESMTVGVGASSAVTRYTYDVATGTITVKRPDNVVQEIMVDKAGRTAGFSEGDGSTVLTSFNSAGRLLQFQPAGRQSYTLGTSRAGRPTGFAPPMVQADASVELRSYDEDGQLQKVSLPGNRSVSLALDPGGRVTQWTFDRGTGRMAYDGHSGLPSRAIDPSGVTTSYKYAGSAPTGLTWSGPTNGSVLVELDPDSRVVSETVSAANKLEFHYDGAGNLIRVGPLVLGRDATSGLVTYSALGVVETRQDFDANGLPLRYSTTVAGKAVLDQRFARDVLGRLKTVTETDGAGKATRTEYSYDPAGRLASVRVNGRAIETDLYDATGNRINVVRSSGEFRANYDARDRLVSWGSTRYAWSPAGYLAQRVDGAGTTTFDYDDFGALRGADLADGRKIAYVVDAEGRRVGRAVAGKSVGYLFGLEGSIAAEVDSTGKVTCRLAYDDLGRLALVQRDGATYRVITDAIGSPRLVIDTRTGAVAETITYDVWGGITADTAPGFTPVGFAGGLRDLDTGLIRFGARDYDPATGRWTASDPLRLGGGDANLYRYAGGDPVNHVDRSGLFIPGALWITPVAVGMGAGWLKNRLSQPSAPANPTPQNGNPPPGGNPSSTSGDWSCFSTGLCGGVPRRGSPGTWGCKHGSCGTTDGHFWCEANRCFAPSGDLCLGAGDDDCSWGDPHLSRSGDRLFDFQAAGEFLIATVQSSQLVMQARQEHLFGQGGVTFNTAVAANVDGDIVGVYAREPAVLMVNDAPLPDADIGELRLPHGGTLARRGGTVDIRWHDGSELVVKEIGTTLNYRLVPSPAVRPTLRGLLGNVPGSPSTIVGNRDGAVFSVVDPAFQKTLYGQFGESWRLKPSESLFHYWPGESAVKFANDDLPSKPMTAASLSAAARSRAEKVCRAFGVQNQPLLDDCILDVGVTGMPAFAAAAAGIAGSTSRPAQPSPAEAAASTGSPDEFAIRIGDTVSPGHPSSGAGSIRPGQHQAYTFSGEAGAIIYVRVGPCEEGAVSLDLQGPDNRLIAGSGRCSDFGPIPLPSTGTYRLMINADPAHAARYTYSLMQGRIDQYSIGIGDTVSPDHPASGAGVIKQLEQMQSYAFAAHAGDVIYLGMGPCEGTSPIFDLVQPDGRTLAGTWNTCRTDVMGREVLPITGTYRIVAHGTDPAAASRYGFFLHAVPADKHFSVRLPFNVSPGVPQEDAGRIGAQGAQQFYDFTANPGAIVHIESKCSCPDLSIRAVSVGDTGRFGYLDLTNVNDDWKLPDGGKYTIQVRSNGYTGGYSFSAAQGERPHH